MEDLFKQGQADKEAARSFADKWASKLSTIPDGSGEKQHCQEFWSDLIEAFGKSRDLLDFEHKTAGNGYADVVSRDLGFIAEQKSKNVPLDKPEPHQGEEVTPFSQAFRYRAGLTSDYSIRTIVTSNFEAFWFYDLMTEGGLKGIPCAKVALEEIPNNLNLFKSLFGGGEVRRQFGILNPEYTEMAAGEVADFYDALKRDVEKNPRFSEAKKKEFEEKIPLIVMRIVFLLFADNTSADIGKIFSSNQFTTFLEKSTDPAHFTRDLLELFKCLSIESEEERADELIPEELMAFPYVDGGLFEETVAFPSISEEAFGKIRDLERKFKQWDEINISVFGPIMDRVFGEERRENGIYYTSRENILKVINPLFMDELRGEFEEIKAIKGHEEKEDKLKAFHGKLSRLQFFDPACGSGNFLTETYMELRDLEDEVIGLENSVHDLDKDVKVSLSQFHGIELEKYGAMVAKTALQIAREQALERSYERFKDSVSAPPHFLPLKDEARGIICGNALTMDWGDLVTPSKDLFIFGNPPFVGDYNKGDIQTKELEAVFGDNYYGKFDYCTAWYYKSATFLNGSGAHFAFVSTNSITQGAQAEPLFSLLFDLGWRISFAYPSFKWDLKGATVAVVIIGMSQDMDSLSPRLWNAEKTEFEDVPNISPYLTALSTVFIKNKTKPLSDLPELLIGSKPADHGGLTSKDLGVWHEGKNDPIARKYIRPYLGAEELIKGKERWCLWITPENYNPEDIKNSKFLMNRIKIVEDFRLKSPKKPTREAAKRPYSFEEIREVTENYLAIPRHFTADREYFTASYEVPDKEWGLPIAGDALYTLVDPQGLGFSVMESRMFKAWQDLVGGRLGTGNRFAGTLVWNTFPLPELSKDQTDAIIEGGAKVLEARANHKDASLKTLYDPMLMPQDLRKAHESLDRAVDVIFSPSASSKSFKTEEERQKALLEAYEKMTGEKTGE